MSWKTVCDGCGREASGYWLVPPEWFTKEVDGKITHACSVFCSERIDLESAKENAGRQ